MSENAVQQRVGGEWRYESTAQSAGDACMTETGMVRAHVCLVRAESVQESYLSVMARSMCADGVVS